MSFAAPLYLLALVLVPLGVVAYLQHERTRRVAADAFAAPAVRASVMPSTPGWRRHVPLAIFGVALIVLILALAKPQTTVAVPVERASIMLTTDYSGSMQATDVKPSRLLAGRAAGEKLLRDVPSGVRVGLVAFNHSARLQSSPTTDRDTVRAALEGLQPSGGTATGEALAVALGALAGQKDETGKQVPSAIILLSDGKSTRGRTPQEVAQRAKELKIPIYTVALGTAAGTIQVTDRNGVVHTRAVPPDPSEMQEVADISGGKTFTADTAQDLSTVYKSLGSQIGYRDEPREITAAFSAGALVLLMAGAAASLLWFRRVV